MDDGGFEIFDIDCNMKAVLDHEFLEIIGIYSN